MARLSGQAEHMFQKSKTIAHRISQAINTDVPNNLNDVFAIFSALDAVQSATWLAAWNSLDAEAIAVLRPVMLANLARFQQLVQSANPNITRDLLLNMIKTKETP